MSFVVARQFSALSHRRINHLLHALPIPSQSSQFQPSHTDIFSKLLSERIIYLAGPIEDSLSTSITAQLLYLESQSMTKPIHLYINSPGGSITAGLAIYDTIQYITSPVSTVCLGQACSMASLLLSAGKEGKRMILPNSIIMIHQPSGGFKGQASDIEIHANHILNTKKKIVALYKKHMAPTLSSEEISKLLERDKFLNAEEAVELGLADKVLLTRNSGD